MQPLDGQYSADDSEDEERQIKKEFNLGRFCAKRTQVFHRFTHWEVDSPHTEFLAISSYSHSKQYLNLYAEK